MRNSLFSQSRSSRRAWTCRSCSLSRLWLAIREYSSAAATLPSLRNQNKNKQRTWYPLGTRARARPQQHGIRCPTTCNACMCACMCEHVCMCECCACMCACTCACMCACTCACMCAYTCACTCTYVHAHVHGRLYLQHMAVCHTNRSHVAPRVASASAHYKACCPPTYVSPTSHAQAAFVLPLVVVLPHTYTLRAYLAPPSAA